MLLFATCCFALALLLPRAPVRARIAPITQRPRDGPADKSPATGGNGDLARDCELFATCLEAGLTLAAAAAAVSTASHHPAHQHMWREVAALARMGTTHQVACEPLARHPELVQLAHSVHIALNSGAPIGPALAQVAERMREEQLTRATSAARRAAVFITIPLAVCFLPAFFILGLGPTIIGIASEMLAGW